MRNSQTEEPETRAESLLWKKLKNRALMGATFKKQCSINGYVVDFFCAEAGVIVEVDDAMHSYREENDSMREECFLGLGYTLVHVKNQAIHTGLNAVIENIVTLVRGRMG